MAEKQQVLTGRRTIGEVSLDTKTIYTIFADASPGDLIPYDVFTRALGRDVRQLWGSVQTAQRMALRELGAVFASVRGIGIKRLTNSEISGLPENSLSRIRRIVAREMRRQAVVNESLLNNKERIDRNVRLSLLGAVAEFARQSAPKRIEAAKPADSLPFGKVMELFR